MKDFGRGVFFWINGWRYIFRERHLLLAAVTPFLISSGAAFSLLWAMWYHFPAWTDGLVRWIGFNEGLLHQLLYYPILISGALLVFVSSIYSLYLIQALIAVPFYSYLATQTLIQERKKRAIKQNWAQWVTTNLRMARISVVRMAILLMVGGLLFVLSLFPVLNIFALAGAFLILAMDCLDYSLEALGLGLRQRLRYFFTQPAQCLGMAGGLALTLLVPGLTFLVIPGAVVGGALIA